MDEQAALKDLFLQGTEGLAAPKPTIKSLSFNHEAIARWLIANPGKIDGGKLGECAKAFGYSRSWLSIIIHSDAFKAKLRELTEEADALVVADIPAKMRGVASMALDALGDQVEAAAADTSVAPRDFLLKTSETLLKNLGYGQKTTVSVNAPGGNVVVGVDGDALARARQKLTQPRANESEPKLIGSGTPETSA